MEDGYYLPDVHGGLAEAPAVLPAARAGGPRGSTGVLGTAGRGLGLRAGGPPAPHHQGREHPLHAQCPCRQRYLERLIIIMAT
eukprot:scaffold236497_cov14-Prasinocladus_malaysianus.AAC.1